MSRLLALLLFTALSVTGSLSHAQTVTLKQPPPTVAPASPPKIDPVVEKKALDLIESLSGQVGNLHSPANLMRAQCAVGDLLWARDEKRARSLFTAALAQLTSRISELDYSDPEVYREMNAIFQSRQELVMRIAGHDADLAMTALRQTRFQNDSAIRVRNNFNYQNEANLEMNVANLIAGKDPAAALKLARNSLSRGVTWNVISFLPQLYQKDQKSGQSLYQEIVTKIKDENLNRNTDLANNAWNLLTSFQPPQADEDTFKDLLTVMVANLFSINRQTQGGIGMAHNLYYQIERIAPLIEKYAPSRTAELREWSQAVERTLEPSARMYQEMHRISQNGTVDEMLALASKYPPEFQNLLYQNAAWKALSTGDTARAKEIAEMSSDPVQRRQMLDQLNNQALSAAEGENKIVEARRLVDQAKNVNQKIEILLRTASTIAAEDKKAALGLLAEAKTILASAPQSAAQFQSHLRLAQTYLNFDVEQSFAILQPLILKLNELVSAAAVLDGIDAQYLKDGEWVMPGTNNLGNVVNSLDQTLAALGQKDFDRARTLADQIERPEMRLLIEIDLALAALGGKAVNQTMFGGPRSFPGMVIVN